MDGAEAVEVADGKVGRLGQKKGSDLGVVADAGEMEERPMLVVGLVRLGSEEDGREGVRFRALDRLLSRNELTGRQVR